MKVAVAAATLPVNDMQALTVVKTTRLLRDVVRVQLELSAECQSNASAQRTLRKPCTSHDPHTPLYKL